MAITLNGTTGISGVDGSAGTPALQGIDGNTGLYFGTDEVSISTGGSQRLVVDSSGRLGLGTSTPGSYDAFADDLVITNGSGNPGITLAGSTTGWGSIYFADGTTGSEPYRGYIQYGHTNDRMTLATAGSGAMHIDSSQRVGIGTTSVNAKLVVSNGGAGGLEVSPDNSSTTIYSYNRSTSSYIEQRYDGSTHIFQVSGSGNEKARIDSSGRLLVGTSSARSQYGVTPKSQVEGTDNTSSFGAIRNSNDAGGAYLLLGKSRGTTTGSSTIVQFNDVLGGIYFQGADGADIATPAAGIEACVDTTPGADDMPGRLVFYTTADGANFLTERMRIGQSALTSINGVYIHTTGNSANVHVDSSAYLLRSTSSIKYKTDVEDAEDQYSEALLQCRPVWYRSTCQRDNPAHSYWGFIAEEVAEIDPRLVHWKTTEPVVQENGSIENVPCDPEPEGVAYERFVPHLLNLIKRQGEAIAELQAEVAALKGA